MQNLNGRIYFLDAMRGVLMMLGVVLHSAQVFNPAKSWALYSEISSPISSFLVEFIHIFRMPAFFIVSGYFCLLTIKRYNPDKFLNVRIKRILIPLLVTAITLNSLQMVILNYTGWKPFDLTSYLTTGGWISHLWFLVNLIVYFFFAYLFAKYLSKQCKLVNDFINRIFKNASFHLILITLPLVWIAIKSTGKLGLPIYLDLFGFISVYELLFYVPYFIFGIWLRENSEQLFRFSNINIYISICLLFASYMISKIFFGSDNIVEIVAYEYFHTLAIWYSSAACFYLFMKFANSHSRFFMFLSGASYTVYLFHHVIVIGLASLFINTGIGGTTGLLTLITLTLILTFSIHQFVISKTPVLMYLYNGKWK